MPDLTCNATLDLPEHDSFLPVILDRLASFQAKVDPATHRMTYAFGWLQVTAIGQRVSLQGGAADAAGLARIKDLMATAFRLYARPQTDLVWQGDLAGDPRLDSFRLMQVETTRRLTPSMQRLRLRGEGLDRFDAFGNMHVRLLLPDPDGPAPVWPVAGADGLAHWPDPSRKPLPRVYTIRQMDAAAGWVEIDVLLHGTHGPGSAWGLSAQPGATVGMLGPLGRPIRRDATQWLMGADETGLPALARLLETLPPHVTGTAFVEVGNPEDRQDIANRTGITLEWLHRGDAPAGDRLADAVLAQGWPAGDSFGWFAAEADAARRIRDSWRGTHGQGRDTTLCAAYWKRGAAGLMAG